MLCESETLRLALVWLSLGAKHVCRLQRYVRKRPGDPRVHFVPLLFTEMIGVLFPVFLLFVFFWGGAIIPPTTRESR